MSIKIIKKEKTKPDVPCNHKELVPLRIVEIRLDRLREVDTRDKGYKDSVDIGDIITVLPNTFHANTDCLFNCTKQRMINNRYHENGAILCLRAYDVESVILCNDNEPAPVE